MTSRDLALLSCLMVMSLLMTSRSVGAGDEPDISGVWEASHDAGTFQVLSVPGRDSGEGFLFLMLELGEAEEEFGFQLGELLATLRYEGDDCWRARERFHLPLWAGGGYYMGQTSYCLTAEGPLQFHTDDEAAVFSDYPLSRMADGIEAAGLWQLVDSEHFLLILLAPLPEGGWQALAVDANEDLLDSGISLGEVLFEGNEPPNEEGVAARSMLWFREIERGEAWLEMLAVLENPDTLHFGIDQGPERGALLLDFERVY
jgi:hypothetical protein